MQDPCHIFLSLELTGDNSADYRLCNSTPKQALQDSLLGAHNYADLELSGLVRECCSGVGLILDLQ